ncbi:DUF3575 domain-containing protein [Phocaeicola dorei]|uniref:DUF3575 domain-containing protein n=2 Tax=Phocaeicola dorei TaxID=357276 RepID=UPI001C39599B|nr:DUF3575 domain-containing protein [Phocaeicola dorei]MBV4239308.1 DUF3575 domain-containing protein [Phocaeicola dorei]MCB6462052.1 DUF3575 domain-containing protein [Phocaeicola dorei]MCB6747415.1 DUF3575 domain-containing protein [Phocaeicola dorei]MCB6772798.1 DUF3575 domain-containing protein [Phocaeicola dorei]MCB6791729.1 DUF3575 domain-containing protein [Phocaeicola dorei]
MKLKVNVLFLFILFLCLRAGAQTVAIKSNLLYDLTSTINIGIEFPVAPKWTVDVSGNVNLWTFSDNRKWKQLVVQPEARYWLCERFNRHFFGAHLLGGIYNFSNLNMGFKFLGTDFGELKGHRYEGWMVGVGAVYGYHWLLSRRWSLEGVIGLGYVYSRADKYNCPTCGKQLENNKAHHYIGPTKLAFNLIYVF